ncbi:nitrite reductase small subunit NirD [Poseidonibacter antarcticus]|uniref:nitrite reductase small subunit NirD n=1 Tax=Poseidonibacter antarcticus TaxID=2478538 RepID=UPI000EF5066C|nr:nitrite reductase small subunit NirD [Poseidonibacter antarcticus]
MSKWIKITQTENIPEMGSRVIQYGELEIAVFKTRDGSIFAINNQCPHKQGKLSEGLVHDHVVTCPMHNWDIDLKSGKALGNDNGCTNTYESKIEDDIFYINL